MLVQSELILDRREGGFASGLPLPQSESLRCGGKVKSVQFLADLLYLVGRKAPVANESIMFPKEKIEEFCHRWKIAEFALFGSVLREDFRSDSDVDILVSFGEDADWDLFDWVNMMIS